MHQRMDTIDHLSYSKRNTIDQLHKHKSTTTMTTDNSNHPRINRRRRRLAGASALSTTCCLTTSAMTTMTNSLSWFAPSSSSVAAFVPTSHTASRGILTGRRDRIRGTRRTVPLVLRDPIESTSADTTPDFPDSASTSTPSTNNHNLDQFDSFEVEQPLTEDVERSAAFLQEQQSLDFSESGAATSMNGQELQNREFTNDLILGEGLPVIENLLGNETILLDDNVLGEMDAAAPLETSVENAPMPVEEDPIEQQIEHPVEDGPIVQIEGIPVSRDDGYVGTATLSGDVPVVLEPFEALESSVGTIPSSLDTDTSASSTTNHQQASSSSEYQIPTLRQIIAFALPATAIYLADPLLSLIDTASVGLLAGVSHQAALSPAIAVVNYSGLLLAFLFVGATNFVAQAAAKSAPTSRSVSSSTTDSLQEKDKDNTSTAKILLSTLQISAHTGTLLGILLFALAPTLITVLSGRSTPLPPDVFLPAVRYVRIRALGFPAAAVLGSAQAACLGLKDTKTPLLVLAAAAVLNVLGDMCLVGWKAGGSWWYGAAGAAWATTIGQFAAVGLFLRLLKSKKRSRVVVDDDTVVAEDDDQSGAGRLSLTKLFARRRSKSRSAASTSSSALESTTMELDAVAADTSSDDTTGTSARGFLAEHNFQPHHILHLPPKETVQQFLPYVVPVTTTSVGRVSLFLSMAHVVSSCMGVVGMAAQTIALGIFDALCPLSQSLTLAAQAFVPGALEEQDRLRRQASGNKKTPDVLAKFSKQFLKAGAAFGLFTALASMAIPAFSTLMTSNAAVVQAVTSVTPQLAVIFAMHGLVMAAEGVLLGKEDVNFLGWLYGAFFFIMPACMMRVKHGALHLGRAAGLDSVWGVFLGYQFVRMLLWSLRAALPTKNSEA